MLAQQVPQSEAAEERDLSRDLIAAMGPAASCLKPRPAGSSPRFQVSLSARVMPGGRIIRGTVSGGGLSTEETECMRARLLQVRLALPMGAPAETVSGTLLLELEGTPAPPRPTPEPAPAPPGAADLQRGSRPYGQ